MSCRARARNPHALGAHAHARRQSAAPHTRQHARSGRCFLRIRVRDEPRNWEFVPESMRSDKIFDAMLASPRNALAATPARMPPLVLQLVPREDGDNDARVLAAVRHLSYNSQFASNRLPMLQEMHPRLRDMLSVIYGIWSELSENDQAGVWACVYSSDGVSCLLKTNTTQCRMQWQTPVPPRRTKRPGTVVACKITAAKTPAAPHAVRPAVPRP
jgi:hypothetical protein